MVMMKHMTIKVYHARSALSFLKYFPGVTLHITPASDHKPPAHNTPPAQPPSPHWWVLH